MKTRLVARAAAAIVAAASMLGIGGVVANSAMAEDTTFTPAAGTITIFAPKTPDPNTTNMVPPTIKDRKFTAYQLASYDRVTTEGTAITSFDLKSTVSDDDLKDWIKTAVVNDHATDENFSNDVKENADGSISFTGDSSNLTPIQFVAKHFYGIKADRYGNDNASNTAMRLFAQAAQESGKLSDGVTVTGTKNEETKNEEAQFTGLTGEKQGLYLIVEDNPAPTGEMLARAMVVGTPYTEEKTEGTATTQTTYVTFKVPNKARMSRLAFCI